MCEGAIVEYLIDYTADEDGCLTSLFYTYITHTCPDESGSGSGGGSGDNGGEDTEYGEDPNPHDGDGPPPAGPPQNPKDPCIEVGTVHAIYRSTNLRNKIATIKSNTNSDGKEWGSAVLFSWGTSGGIEHNVWGTTLTSDNSVSHWTPPPFEWDPINNRRAWGYIHSHPNGTAPSPQDVMNIIQNSLSTVFVNDESSQNEYMRKAFVTSVTNSGNYTVTVNNWTVAHEKLADFNENKNVYTTNYTQAYQNYLINHPNDKASASIYALQEVFPGMLNIYRSTTSTPHIYTPTRIGRNSSNRDEVQNINCPQ